MATVHLQVASLLLLLVARAATRRPEVAWPGAEEGGHPVSSLGLALHNRKPHTGSVVRVQVGSAVQCLVLFFKLHVCSLNELSYLVYFFVHISNSSSSRLVSQSDLIGCRT